VKVEDVEVGKEYAALSVTGHAGAHAVRVRVEAPPETLYVPGLRSDAHKDVFVRVVAVGPLKGSRICRATDLLRPWSEHEILLAGDAARREAQRKRQLRLGACGKELREALSLRPGCFWGTAGARIALTLDLEQAEQILRALAASGDGG